MNIADAETRWVYARCFAHMAECSRFTATQSYLPPELVYHGA